MQDNFGGTGLGMGLPDMVPDSVSGCPIWYRANEVLHFSFLLNYELYCKQNLPSKALWNVPEYHQQSGSGDPGAPPCPKCNKRTGRWPWNPVLKNL